MARIESWFNQDLKKPVTVHQISGNVFSQDNLGNLIGVRVFDNGEPAALSGSVSANVIRPDGGTVAVAGSLSSNEASVELPQAAYAYPGMIAIIIKLTSGSTVTTLCAVTAIVYRSSTDTTIDPGTIVPSIQNLIAQIDAAVASIPLDYSALNAEVSNLKSAIHVKKASPVTYVDGKAYRADTNVETSGNYRYAKYAISGENEFVVYGRSFGGSGKWPMIIYLDANNTTIKTECLTSAYYGPVKTSVPSEATFLIINGANEANPVNDPTGALIYVPTAGMYADDIDGYPEKTDSLYNTLMVNLGDATTDIYFETSLNNDIYFTLTGTLYIRGFTTKYRTLRMSYSGSSTSVRTFDSVGTLTASPLGRADCLLIANNHGVGFNITTDALVDITGGTAMPSDIVPIFYNVNGSIVSGIGQYLYTAYVIQHTYDIPKTAKLAFIGDSIGSFEGWSESHSDTVTINNVSYPYRAPYYPNGDVTAVSETWWYQVAQALQIANLVVSSVSRSRFRNNQVIDGVDGSPAPWHPDRIQRIVDANPDDIIIVVGANDVFSWNDDRDGIVPTTTDTDTLDAMNDGTGVGAARTICKLRKALPNVKIIGILPKFPAITESLFEPYQKMRNTLTAVYHAYGVRVLDFGECGIDRFNAVSLAVDSDGTHPNANGMKLMSKYVLSNL